MTLSSRSGKPVRVTFRKHELIRAGPRGCWESKITWCLMWPQTVEKHCFMFSIDKIVSPLQKNSYLEGSVASHSEDRPSDFRRKWLHIHKLSQEARQSPGLYHRWDMSYSSESQLWSDSHKKVLSHCPAPNFQNQRRPSLSLLHSADYPY